MRRSRYRNKTPLYHLNMELDDPFQKDQPKLIAPLFLVKREPHKSNKGTVQGGFQASKDEKQSQ